MRREHPQSRLAVLALLSMVLCHISYAKTIYVDDDATGTNAGSNWEDAYTSLQDALSEARIAPKPVEICVAQGVYKPNQIAENRIIKFQLINNVTLSGGYAGLTEHDPNARDVDKYETILSGDLNGDDINVDSPGDLLNEATRSDNCSSIIVGSYTDRTAVLDGFTITGGCARIHPAAIDHPTGVGGGMKIESGSPTINDCTFAGNSAEGSGGGVYNFNGNPSFNNCTFTGNCADYGAGMASDSWPQALTLDIELVDCTFENNNAGVIGGGLVIYRGEAILMGCVFVGNSASQGGGMYSRSGNLKLMSCQFIRNHAKETGGGLASGDEIIPRIEDCVFFDNSSNRSGGGLAGGNSLYNCTISGNTTVNGGAIYGWGEVINCTVIGNRAGGNGGGICAEGIVTLNNSIIRDNIAFIGNEIYLGSRILPAGRSGTTEKVLSVMTVSYSNVRGGQEEVSLDADCTLAWELGNIDIDPLFAQPGYWASIDDPNVVVEPNDLEAVWVDGDYHLKSQAGRWDPNSQSWVQDDVTSPCIDAGDPNSPIGHEPFPNGGGVNMGAYGGTGEASKSYFGGPVCETVIAGDINGDCKVDFEDLMILVRHWHEDELSRTQR